jgi:hypothetical protein
MRKYLFLFITIAFCKCDCEGWPPGTTGNSSGSNPPKQGCNRDVTVYYKNNSSTTVFVYYAEMKPGDQIPCGNMSYLEQVLVNNTTTGVPVHKGKLMHFIFVSVNDPCSAANTISDVWVDCGSANSNAAYFNVK